MPLKPFLFRKRPSNRNNLKMPALRFIVDGKHLMVFQSQLSLHFQIPAEWQALPSGQQDILAVI